MAMRSQDEDPEIDPFLCNCAKCERFWHKSFGDANLVRTPAVERAAETSVMFKAARSGEKHPAVLRLGDRVLVQNILPGVVKWVGILKDERVAPTAYVGVSLDDNIGSPHNGVYNGKRYFHCPRGHGLMVQYSDLVRVQPPDKRPAITGNIMFPSFKEIKARRKIMIEKDPNMFRPGGSHNNTPGKRTIFDPNDLEARSSYGKREFRFRRAKPMSSDEKEAAQRESMLKMKERFGGDRRGERLARTLQTLQKAYDEGIEYKRKEDKGILSDPESEEEFGKVDSMDKSREKLKRRSSVRQRQKEEIY